MSSSIINTQDIKAMLTLGEKLAPLLELEIDEYGDFVQEVSEDMGLETPLDLDVAMYAMRAAIMARYAKFRRVPLTPAVYTWPLDKVPVAILALVEDGDILAHHESDHPKALMEIRTECAGVASSMGVLGLFESWAPLGVHIQRDKLERLALCGSAEMDTDEIEYTVQRSRDVRAFIAELREDPLYGESETPELDRVGA